MIINFNSICDAVCYWLGYQFKIGRERLIHEASLRYPIADAITSGETAIDKIQLEKGHPYFDDKVVDIFVCTENVNPIKLDNISSIFELKLSTKITANKFGKEHQRVVDDILRLAYFNLKSKKDAYFLICGSYGDFKNYFIGDIQNQTTDANQNIQVGTRQGLLSNTISQITADSWKTDNSLYKEYFDFQIYHPSKSKEYTFEIQNEDVNDTAEMKKEKLFGLKSFQNRYTSKKDKSTNLDFISFSNKLKIKTTCVAITPFESKPSRTHACGIWKIEAVS